MSQLAHVILKERLTGATRRCALLLLALLTIGGRSHAEPKTKPAPRQGTIYDSEPTSITVRGQAKDREGRAIVGATVYLAIANDFGKFGYDAVLGQDVTDEQGCYEISTASLPVRMFPPKPEVVEGKFQVFGTAAGYGLTWHGTRAFRPRPRPADGGEPDMGRAYYEGEPIVNDLVSGPEAVVAGRITDDLGRPLVDAKVQFGVADDARRPSFTIYRMERLPESDTAPADADRVFYRVTSLPQFFLSTRSDADGRYRIGGLPRKAVFLAQATYLPEYQEIRTTIATKPGPVKGAVVVGGDGDEWNPVLAAPRTVFVQCLYADTGEPAEGVTLCAQGHHFQMAGAGAVADNSGQAMLELTPDDYQLAAEPALGTPYLRSEHPLKVSPMPLEQKAEVFIERGAIVEIQAVDADTGQPATGVSFDYQTDTSALRLELQSQTVFVDHPLTDQNGKLRAVVAPGKRAFALGKTTKGYRPSEHQRLVELTAGKTTFVRFQLQRPEAEAQPPAASAGDPRETRLYELAERQQSLVFRGTIRYRICRMPVAGASRDDFRELIASFGNSPPSNLMDRINERFPDWKIRFSEPYEMTIDGDRTRIVSRSPEDGKFAQPRTEVFNGRELVLYEPLHGQVAVGERQFLRRHIDGFRDFVRWPSMPATFFAGVAADASTSISQADGKTTIAWQSAGSAGRLVADEQTGFAYEIASYRKADGYGHDEWQFDPQTAGGVILPRLRIVVRSMSDSVNFIQIHAIESIEAREELPANAFAVAVPPGTYFQVYDGEQPKHSMCIGPVSDAVSFAEAISPRNRSLFPFLQRGKPVPRLAVETWLNQDGITKPPEFANKVVLIDFWSIGCGPCVAELPALQAIVEKYAGTDLMVIGVHERGAAVGELVEFAKKHGLSYVLGIDAASEEQGWFGESFKTYGVRGIPHAALIDRHGRLLLIEHLPAVTQRIDDALAEK